MEDLAQPLHAKRFAYKGKNVTFLPLDVTHRLGCGGVVTIGTLMKSGTLI
jgi:hypothetical protein